MKKIVLGLILALLPGLAPLASEHPNLDSANVNLSDRASLQRGARVFMNYCLSCHSAHFMRYNRMAKDLGLTDKEVAGNLMFASDKVGGVMNVAMRSEDAGRWFGVAPPDLSVISRARGADWLYTYLRSFYLDPSRPSGVNNLVFDKVAMPDVLWRLQGLQRPVYHEVTNEDGAKVRVIEKLELAVPGTMTPGEYDRTVRDLVNFLAYMGEPAKLQRSRLGGWVLLFLVVFFLLAYALKKEYWKDVQH